MDGYQRDGISTHIYPLSTAVSLYPKCIDRLLGKSEQTGRGRGISGKTWINPVVFLQRPFPSKTDSLAEWAACVTPSSIWNSEEGRVG